VSLRPLSESEVDRLLGELCVRLGFCLPPDDQERLRADPPSDADTLHGCRSLQNGWIPSLPTRPSGDPSGHGSLTLSIVSPSVAQNGARKRSGRWR
jgi:hypothetical protein